MGEVDHNFKTLECRSLQEMFEEMHRLRESQMVLLLKAEALGLSIPKSCCAHPGEKACVPCSLEWLIAFAGQSRRAMHHSSHRGPARASGYR